MGRRKNDDVVKEIARYTYDWINSYVPNLRTNSTHTVRAYTTAINLYISYLELSGIKTNSFTTECFSASYITDWLLWLKTKRNCSSRTCNSRLAAIKCLLKYVGMRNKAYQFLYIDAADSVKRLKEPIKQVHGMTKDAVKALLATPDPETRIGLRDIAIMSFEYGTATRIDEVLSVKIGQLHMNGEKPYVTVIGKGSKIRSMGLYHCLDNPIERCVKDMVIGRKNYLFCGNHDAAEDAAVIYTFMGCCKLADVDVRKWLSYFLNHIHDYDTDYSRDLSELFPHNLKKAGIL